LDIFATYAGAVDLLTVAALRRYLRRKLRLKVDVVSKEFLSIHIKYEVLEEGAPV
jgi:predicted nucleotidyltransferase